MYILLCHLILKPMSSGLPYIRKRDGENSEEQINRDSSKDVRHFQLSEIKINKKIGLHIYPD